MKRRMTIAFALLSSLLILIPVAAQGPPGGGGRGGVGPIGVGPGAEGPEAFGPGAFMRRRGGQPGGIPSRQFLKRVLNFSEEQFGELKALLEAHRVVAEPLHEQIRDLEGQLRDELDSGEANPARVGQLVIDTHGLRGQIHDTRAALAEDFKALLDEEQLKTLEEIGNRRPGRGRPGPGGGKN